MGTKLYILQPHIESARPVAHAKRATAVKTGGEMRKAGRSSTVKQVVFPKMPKADLLAAIHNHDYSMAEVTDLKTFTGVKAKKTANV